MAATAASPSSSLHAAINESVSAGRAPARCTVSSLFPGLSRSILAKLGYQILTAEEFDSVSAQSEFDRPDLRIVDERTLSNVVDDDGPPIPIIVLTGRHGVTGADQRIVGALKRPAGLHELYRLMQQVLEDTPRAAPRVPTHLPATAIRDGKEALPDATKFVQRVAAFLELVTLSETDPDPLPGAEVRG